jgi:hypothetical protein
MSTLLDERYRVDAEAFAQNLSQFDDFDFDFTFDSELLDVNANQSEVSPGKLVTVLFVYVMLNLNFMNVVCLQNLVLAKRRW